MPISTIPSSTACFQVRFVNLSKSKNLFCRCLLSLNDLRLEVFRATSREDLDTCCLVSKKWKGEIDKSAHTLSLHQGYVHIVPVRFSLT